MRAGDVVDVEDVLAARQPAPDDPLPDRLVAHAHHPTDVDRVASNVRTGRWLGRATLSRMGPIRPAHGAFLTLSAGLATHNVNEV